MIRVSRFQPDIVIAIGRGGYVPARIVCDRLLMNDLTSIKIEHWGTAAHKLDQAQVRFPLSVNVEGMDILVVDDITDTGETLMAAREYLALAKPGEIRTGVLQHKTVYGGDTKSTGSCDTALGMRLALAHVFGAYQDSECVSATQHLQDGSYVQAWSR